MLTFANVNWLAVVVAAVANVVIGAVWFLPQAFGARYLALTGRTGVGAQPTAGYAVAIVSALVSAAILEVLAKSLGAQTLSEGVVLGVVVWLGFIATWSAVSAVFDGRSWKFWAIVNGNAVITFVVMGAVIGYLA
jgi:hypothetical protein